MNHGIRSKSRTHPMLTTLLILVSAIGVVRPVSTQPPSGQASPRSTLPRPASLNRVKPLTEGEKLVYNVSWSNIPAAARLELETGAKGLYHGRESHLIQTRVLTLNEGWSVFGEIDNQYSSYIDPRSYLPHRLVSSLLQGRVNAQQQELLVSIDQAQATATFSATLGATMGDGIRMAIPSSTFDLSSLLLALRTGACILPNAFAAYPSWRLHSWDRFVIPKPFGRLICAYGEPIQPPENRSAEALEATRRQLDHALNSLHERIERRIGDIGG